MRRRRWLIAGAGAVVVLVALIPVGRWEALRHANDENAGIRRIVDEVGPLDQPSLDAYRKSVGPGLDCLLYKRGANPFALELCFDGSGRVVEAYDRRGGSPRIWSLREDPARATLMIDRAKAEALLAALQKPAR